jgi:hypothetical protein
VVDTPEYRQSIEFASPPRRCSSRCFIVFSCFFFLRQRSLCCCDNRSVREPASEDGSLRPAFRAVVAADATELRALLGRRAPRSPAGAHIPFELRTTYPARLYAPEEDALYRLAFAGSEASGSNTAASRTEREVNDAESSSGSTRSAHTWGARDSSPNWSSRKPEGKGSVGNTCTSRTVDPPTPMQPDQRCVAQAMGPENHAGIQDLQVSWRHGVEIHRVPPDRVLAPVAARAPAAHFAPPTMFFSKRAM